MKTPQWGSWSSGHSSLSLLPSPPASGSRRQQPRNSGDPGLLLDAHAQVISPPSSQPPAVPWVLTGSPNRPHTLPTTHVPCSHQSPQRIDLSF